MKRTIITCFGMAFIACLSAQEVERTTDGVKNFIRMQNVTEEIRFYSDDIVRVIKYPSTRMPEKKATPNATINKMDRKRPGLFRISL